MKLADTVENTSGRQGAVGAPGAARVRSIAFRNWPLAFLDLAGAAVALAIFVLRAPAAVGLLAMPVAVALIYFAIAELRGIKMGEEFCSWPARRQRVFPLVSSGRKMAAYESIEEITMTPGFMGMQMVLMEGSFGADLLTFSNRAARLKFFDVVKERAPRVKIYRYAF